MTIRKLVFHIANTKVSAEIIVAQERAVSKGLIKMVDIVCS